MSDRFHPIRPAGLPALPRPQRRQVLLITLLLGLALFAWQLGSTGLVDETPPLFAASARAMVETGDWLIPCVNGLPRYDKPPLVYWLMGLLYALPAQDHWNPLGTWAARFPSALAAVGVMLALADTLLRWPQPQAPAEASQESAPRPGATALTAALAFGLSPLMLVWGRTAVSDSLFSGLVALTLLLCWQVYADPGRPWWLPWPVLGLAVLAKGPVAVVLAAITLLLFGWLQADGRRAVAAAAAAAGSAAHRPGGPALVCAGPAQRGPPLLGQFLRLPQPAALHRSGEPPSAALVVLPAGDARRQSAGVPAAAGGAGPGHRPAPPVLVPGDPPTARRLPGPLRRLLAAGGAAVLHRRRHQTAELLAAGHPRRRPADRPGGPEGLGRRGGGQALGALGLGRQPAAGDRCWAWRCCWRRCGCP